MSACRVALRSLLTGLLLAAAWPLTDSGARAQETPRAPAPEPDGAAPAPAPAEPIAAPETALVRRLSDVVAIREAPGAPERTLYYFRPTAELVQGAHVAQGSGGHSEVHLAEGGHVAMHATGHLILTRLAPAGDLLRFPLATRLDVRAGLRPLEVVLPGGARCHLLETVLAVDVEPGRLRLRNDGSRPIEVLANLRLVRDAPEQGSLMLERGQEVVLPLVGTVSADAELQTVPWGQLLVRHGPGVSAEAREAELWVRRAQSSEGAPPTADTEFTVGGVRTRLGVGTLIVGDPRHAPASPEPAAEPPAESPAEPETPPEGGREDAA
ncbi:MAG: hypothetical protein ACT4PU_02460 [Planctomycetota bacterium]